MRKGLIHPAVIKVIKLAIFEAALENTVSLSPHTLVSG
jgi:hypothetical protein